jgi:hypothetical protein
MKERVKMNNDELKNSLLRLHVQLEKTDTIEPELRDILETLNADITVLLSAEKDKTIADTLVERVQETSAKFAVKHPHLEPILQEIGQILSRMGI